MYYLRYVYCRRSHVQFNFHPHSSDGILVGAGGSLAIEILSLYNEIRASNASGLPAYYKNPLFWFVRLLVTGIAGGLAIAEEAARPLLAINIGASAPAILQLLTKPAGPPGGGGGAG